MEGTRGMTVTGTEPKPAESASAHLADIVVIAAAEAFRGDGEIFASGMGTIQMLGARTAKATFEPDLMVSDGEAFFVGNDLPIGSTDKVVEAWVPFRTVFDMLWSGRRHVMMGASQIDRYGNTNIANIGPFQQPKVQLLGVRGGPGNTISHATSFFIPRHSTRIFVDHVDMVSGLGYDRVARLSPVAQGHHRLPRVITNLAVLDFETPDHSMRLRSVHP
ncbi:MAG TPA: CoA-transferase, partial [Ilumatobacteraceae bacterium]|nr:CoA-transferase [Ilumatobacteraceae bacterium]